jgi:hypothetical protein
VVATVSGVYELLNVPVIPVVGAEIVSADETAKDCETETEFQSTFPSLKASIVHVPAETRVTVVDETVQTGWVVDLKETPSPLALVLVAETVKVLVPIVRSCKVPKVMVWLDFGIV